MLRILWLHGAEVSLAISSCTVLKQVLCLESERLSSSRTGIFLCRQFDSLHGAVQQINDFMIGGHRISGTSAPS